MGCTNTTVCAVFFFVVFFSLLRWASQTSQIKKSISRRKGLIEGEKAHFRGGKSSFQGGRNAYFREKRPFVVRKGSL